MEIFLIFGAGVLLYFLFFGLFRRSHLATVTLFAVFFSGYAWLEAVGWVADSAGVASVPLLFFAVWAASNMDAE